MGYFHYRSLNWCSPDFWLAIDSRMPHVLRLWRSVGSGPTLGLFRSFHTEVWSFLALGRQTSIPSRSASPLVKSKGERSVKSVGWLVGWWMIKKWSLRILIVVKFDETKQFSPRCTFLPNLSPTHLGFESSKGCRRSCASQIFVVFFPRSPWRDVTRNHDHQPLFCDVQDMSHEEKTHGWLG